MRIKKRGRPKKRWFRKSRQVAKPNSWEEDKGEKKGKSTK